MKSNIKYYLCCIITLGFLNSCKQGGNNETSHVYVYSFNKTEKLSSGNVKRMIQDYLGETAPENLYVSDDNIAYYVSDKDVNVKLEQDLNTGDFTFSKSLQNYMGDAKPSLPSSEESIRMANEYMKQKNLLPKDMSELKVVHKGGLRSTTLVKGDKPGEIIDKMITITYGRVVDSLPVIGPGSKIVVNIGDKGEITGMIHRWRELLKADRKEVPVKELITLEEAKELAKKQIMSEYGENTRYEIKGTNHAYYDNNGNILQPVYMFETTVNFEDKNLSPIEYLCVIPMLKNSPEPLNLASVDPAAKKMLQEMKEGQGTNTDADKRTED